MNSTSLPITSVPTYPQPLSVPELDLATGLAGNFYNLADRLFAKGSGTRLPVSDQLCTTPIETRAELRDGPQRLAVLHEFFDTSLAIFREALTGSQPREIVSWLMNNTPVSLGRKWHLKLPEAVYARPTFYRTDEGPDGRILEVQCPGSGWGDLQFLRDVYLEANALSGSWQARCAAYNPAFDFSNEIIHHCGVDRPSVLHLLDNASAPGPMRYFMSATSPPLAYWGYDPGVKNRECHFVRSHSVFGTVAENLFTVRLEQAQKGQLKFDLPPIVLFDQKAPLALPFWEPTRARFSDQVRAAFAYSYPLTQDGFRDERGNWVSLEELRKRPPELRRYFVKYAGVDVATNWGSRAVFRLSDDGFKKTLGSVQSELEDGRPWIIQPDVSGRETASFFDRKTAKIATEELYAKYSRFYGPRSRIGTRVMYRKSVKVHGQSDTAIGLVL